MSEFPKAYLRISPNLDQHPDPAAMVRAICAANRQSERGRFREPAVLERAVGRKSYRTLVERGDIVPANPGPGVYLEGWDQWQEGDHTVAERMKRLRQRQRNGKVTPPPSPDRNGVTTTALENTSTVGSSQASDVDETPPPQVGRRKDGTNARALGTNARANGTAPRQLREAEKRGPIRADAILAGLGVDEHGKYVVRTQPAPKPSARKTA